MRTCKFSNAGRSFFKRQPSIMQRPNLYKRAQMYTIGHSMVHNWDSSKRPNNPPGWANTRTLVIQRAGGICQHEDGCTHKGTDVDHIVNLAAGGSHDPNNLRLLCTWHHKRKTAQEAAKARGPRVSEYRDKGKHPGIA